MKLDWERANREDLAAKRHRLHEGQKSSRPLSRDYELVGLAGEYAFAEAYGLSVDETERPGGDSGSDFVVNGITIDIKTARKAYNLIVEEGKIKADIYVLAQYEGDTDATLLGWATRRQVSMAPTKDFGYGINNHYISKGLLSPMPGLKRLL